MLGLVTTKSTVLQPTESRIQLTASTDYLINMSNIIKMSVYSTDDSEVRYKLNKKEDRTFPFLLIVDQTNSALQTLADVSASSNMIPLPIFEGAVSFHDSTGSTTTKYFNIDDITWVEENDDATMCKMWVEQGGFGLAPYFVNYSLAQVYDVLTSGSTTTTTSTTSSTTTS